MSKEVVNRSSVDEVVAGNWLWLSSTWGSFYIDLFLNEV